MKASVRAPQSWAMRPPGPSGPSSDEQVEAQHGGRQHQRQRHDRGDHLLPPAGERASHHAIGVPTSSRMTVVMAASSIVRRIAVQISGDSASNRYGFAPLVS